MTSAYRQADRSCASPGPSRRCPAATPSPGPSSKPRPTFSRRTALCLALLLLLSPGSPHGSSSQLVLATQLSPRPRAQPEPISDPRWGTGWLPGISNDEVPGVQDADDERLEVELPLVPGEGGSPADAPGFGVGTEGDGGPQGRRPPKGDFVGNVEPVVALDAPVAGDGVELGAMAQVKTDAVKAHDAHASKTSPSFKELPWTIGGMRHYDEPPGSGGARPTRGWTGKWPPWDKWEVVEEMRKAAFLAAGGEIRDTSVQEEKKAGWGLGAWFGSKGGEKHVDGTTSSDSPLLGQGGSTGLIGDGTQAANGTLPGAKGHARHGDGSRWACRSTGACVACAKDEPFPASCHPYGRHRSVECIRLQHSTGLPVGVVAGAPPVLAGGKKGWRRSLQSAADHSVNAPLRARADGKKDAKAAAPAAAADQQQQEQQQEQQVTGWDGERVILSGWEGCGRSTEEAGWGFAKFVSLNLLLALGALWLLISRQKVMSSRWRGIVERRIGRRA